MKKILLTFVLALLLSGCNTSRYGYSFEEWDGMSRYQRDAAQARAERMQEFAQQQQRDKEIMYQPLNVIFGSRSNVYGSIRYPYPN